MPRTIFHMLGTMGPGGEERQVLTLVNGLDRSRWTSIVCAARGGLLEDDFRAVAQTHVMGKRGKVDLSLVLRIRRLLDRYNPAIVHTHLSTANTWGRVAVALKPWRRPVVIAHEGSVDTWKKWYHVLPDRLLMPVTDRIVGVSHAVGDFIVRHHGIPERKVLTIHNGIDLSRAQRHIACSQEERTHLRSVLGLSPGHFVIGHIGRCVVQKALPVLVDVIERLVQEYPHARFLRVGQPPSESELPVARAFEEAIQKRGLSKYLVLHPYTPDISSALAVMDALVQTSTHEGLGNAVIEAMSMELPVVVTAAPGTLDVVTHEQTGWMVPVNDVAGLVEGLAHVIKHPDTARKWGLAGRRRAEDTFSSEIYLRNTEALYEQLLQRRGVA